MKNTVLATVTAWEEAEIKIADSLFRDKASMSTKMNP